MERLSEEKLFNQGKNLSDNEASALLHKLPEWEILTKNGIQQLERVYKFKNFNDALIFTNRVGAIAEEADHHPTLITEWGRCSVTWWTHNLGGLQRNDFIMAAKTDQLYDY